jgi:hypothetical protein
LISKAKGKKAWSRAISPYPAPSFVVHALCLSPLAGNISTAAIRSFPICLASEGFPKIARASPGALGFPLRQACDIARNDHYRVEKETFLGRPSPRPRRDASRNELAVAAAHDLLNWWGERTVVSRTGKWAQLAKILAGDMTVDLFDHLREFKRRPRPAIEKLRYADSIVYRTRRRQPGIK